MAHIEPGAPSSSVSSEVVRQAHNTIIGISRLPPEILSHIFVVGSENDSDKEEIDDDDTSSPGTHFATLCSHVCQYWRTVATDTPQLWSSLDFEEGPPYDKSREWIARSKAMPLTLEIDQTGPEDSEDDEEIPLARTFIIKQTEKIPGIIGLILPEAHRWKSLEIVVDYFELIWLWQHQLLLCGPTPILERLGFFCHDNWFDIDTFHPPELRNPISILASGAPKLKSITLWGVHIDWETASFLEGLEFLQLAFHTKDVRIRLDHFIQVLTKSPELKELALEGSAPLAGDWPYDRIPLNSLRDLIITYLDLEDASAIVDHIDFPVLRSVILDLESDNLEPFIDVVCKGKHPRFRSVESLKLISFECSPAAGKRFLYSMPNLTSMTLNFNFLPMHFFNALFTRAQSRAAALPVCPKLDTLKLSGLEGKALKKLITARKNTKGVAPILRLYIDRDDDLGEEVIIWLKEQVEEFSFYEPSDDEEDDEDDDDEDDDDEDEDEGHNQD